MNHKEILKNIKELVGLEKQEAKEIDVVEEVVLSTEDTVEKVIDEAVENVELSTEEVVEEVIEETVELADEVAEEPVKEVEQVPVGYATQEELSQVKQELLSMIKALIEDKSDVSDIEVPTELSVKNKQEEVELSENVEEVIHSPEAQIEKKKNLLSNPNKSMTIEERVNRMLFN